MANVNIVRVKRKLSSTPIDAINVSYKKSRLNDGKQSYDDFKDTFQFLGTTYHQDDSLCDILKKSSEKKNLEADFKIHRPTPVSERSRSAQRKQCKQHRFKVLSKTRGLSFDDLIGHKVSEPQETHPETCQIKPAVASQHSSTSNEATAKENTGRQEYNLIDIEIDEPREVDTTRNAVQGAIDTVMCNGVALVSEKKGKPAEAQYVYDIYHTTESNLDFRALEQDLLFESLRNDDLILQEDSDDSDTGLGYREDEDDENEENNWRNDYPDEDEYNFFADELEDEDSENEECEPRHHDSYISHVLGERLKITDSDDELASDSETEGTAGGARNSYEQYWTPKTSYESYKKRMMRQIYADELHDDDKVDKDDADND